MAFYTTYEGVGVARTTDDTWATEIVPAGRVEDTVAKTPWAKTKARSPGSSSNPTTILRDTKITSRKFVVTGTVILANGVTAATKRENLLALYGYSNNSATLTTLAVKDTDGNWETYDGLITRLTFSRNGGELFYELIMEFIVGTLNASD